MKYLILFSSLLISIVSCKSVNKQIAEEITGADSVAINYFRGDGTIDTVTAVKVISDKASMDALTKFIASKFRVLELIQRDLHYQLLLMIEPTKLVLFVNTIRPIHII